MLKTDQERQAHRDISPVICYPNQTLPKPDLDLYLKLRSQSHEKLTDILVPPREARCFEVPKGGFFRITSHLGAQVGDLNLWNKNNLNEKFYSGKTRALHGTHITTGERMWSSFPYLRPMATIVEDTLNWYGIDPHGGSVHDVIGTRCDPYTHALLTEGVQYHHCCHSNLLRALSDYAGLALKEAEQHVHDVLNVFMCTGFTRETGQYFMKKSPVQPGDYLEFFAEIDLLGALSACPGGDCGSEHSSDVSQCFPLRVEVFAPSEMLAESHWRSPSDNAYDGSHGF